MAQMRWRSALSKLVPVFFSPQESWMIESNIDSNPGSEKRVEAAVSSQEHPLSLARYFKYFLLQSPQQIDNDWLNKFDKRLIDAWKREVELPLADCLFPEYNRGKAEEGTIVDLSQMLDWLPREDNLYSLGREGSTGVTRVVTARVVDIGREGFSSFWMNNKSSILASIPKSHLLQRATQESNPALRTDSYMKLRSFLVELAKGIANARGVTVDIAQDDKGAEDIVHEGGYSRIPDSFIKIGDSWVSLELKTRGVDPKKIVEARGQVVVLGNIFFRQKSRYVPMATLRNEMYGFVGDGVRLQCVRQIHAYKENVKTYDGPLLPLAEGEYQAGETFTIDINSDAVVWAAAALDNMVVTEAERLHARAEVKVRNDSHRDGYGQLKLTVTSGYRIGNEYLHIPGKAPLNQIYVTVLGASRNNDISVVLRVLWKGEMWWLKLGPDAEIRQKALRAPHELPTGGWERWFQTERDMLSRALLDKGSEAFAVVVVAGSNRPAMLVKDAGDSLEKRLFARQMMTPAEVYEMSKQLYTALEASGKQDVIHGDVCLENICEKNGVYSLIDWGLASGRPFQDLAAVVDQAWPDLDVMNQTPGIPNWEMSADCCFLGVRPYNTNHDMESFLYCCMKLLGGNVLPWSDAARSGLEEDVLNLRAATIKSFVKTRGSYVYEPLLLKLGLIDISEDSAQNVEVSAQQLEPISTVLDVF